MAIETLHNFTGDEVIATELPSLLNNNFKEVDEKVKPISQGGTGATTASQARANLGLGSVATENIIPISKGGTGATTASQACANLGAVRSVNNVTPDSNGNVKVESTSLSAIVDLIYPVGSLYWSKKSTSPATLFGGTWTQIKDKFILAAGDSYAQGATGGSATVTLTTAQLPAHSHSGSAQSNGGHSHGASSNNTGGHSHSIATKGDYGGQPSYNAGTSGTEYSGTVNTNSAGSHSHTITVNSAGAHTHNLTINNTGSGQAHENMPPYVTYYCWERTA